MKYNILAPSLSSVNLLENGSTGGPNPHLSDDDDDARVYTAYTRTVSRNFVHNFV